MMQKKQSSQPLISVNKAIAAIAGLVLFALIAYSISSREVLTFDTVIREWVYGIRNDVLTPVLKVITYSGNWQSVTLICFILLIIPRLRLSFGIPISLTALICNFIQDSLKTTFQRIRPDVSLHLIEQGGFSFPSGHSFTNFVFYGMLIYLCRKKIKNKTTANWLSIFFSCLIFLIGFSRVYLGVHFPTDVLGSWALGLSLLMILTSVMDLIQRHK